MQATSLTIEHRYRGWRALPAGEHYGHGGYFCGRVAQIVPGLKALSILKSIPLDRELTVRASSPLQVTVHAGDVEIANSVVRGAPIAVTLPGSVTIEEATEAAARFPGFTRHPFPECFACGHLRAESGGLSIFTGSVGEPVNGEPQLAGVWTPDSSCLGTDGFVRLEIVWAALDCPGGWAIPGKCSTVALQVDILERVPGNRPLILRGWLQQPVDPDPNRKSRFAG